VVHVAVDMLGGDLDPGWYGYGTLNMYVLLLVYRVAYGAKRAMGLVTDMEDFARALFRGGLFFQIVWYVHAVYGVATAAVLVSAPATVGRRVLMLAGALAAACISVKLSGALLLTLPAVLAIIGLRRRSVSARDVALWGLASIAIGLLTTPFINPVAAMLDTHSTRIASDPRRFGTQFFPSRPTASYASSGCSATPQACPR
jgi:hypothetical protein